jgi:hypothetical protein
MHAWRPDGTHLRDIAFELRDLAGRCQFPCARLELRELAVQFERRAGHLDDMTGLRSVVPGVRWIQFDLTDEEASALRKLLAEAIDYDRYPLSLRIQALRRILAKFEPLTPPPPPARPTTPEERDPSRGLHRSHQGSGRRERARCAAIVRSRAGDPVEVIAQAIERDDPPQPEKSARREPIDPEISKDWRDAVF